MLIFKDYGAPFYLEVSEEQSKRMGWGDIWAINNYMVYWKGKFLNHNLPKVIQREYGDFFNKLIKNPIPTYFEAGKFPKKAIEIPIPLLRSNIKLHGPKHLTKVKKILKKLDFLLETRGKNKKPNEFRERRKELLIINFIKLGRKKPYPMTKIQNITYNQLCVEFPLASYDKLKISDDQIRRILDSYRSKTRLK